MGKGNKVTLAQKDCTQNVPICILNLFQPHNFDPKVRISDLSSVNIHWKMLTLARPANKMEEIIFTKFALMTMTLVIVVWTYECLVMEMRIMTTTIVITITIVIVNNGGDNQPTNQQIQLDFDSDDNYGQVGPAG